jgi:hypothetical protein
MRRITVLLGLRDRLPNTRASFTSVFVATSLGKIQTEHRSFQPVKNWEVIADNLSNAGWSWGCISPMDSYGRTIWIVDADGYGKRFVVRADEILTAFLEAERAIHQFAVSLLS